MTARFTHFTALAVEPYVDAAGTVYALDQHAPLGAAQIVQAIERLRMPDEEYSSVQAVLVCSAPCAGVALDAIAAANLDGAKVHVVALPAHWLENYNVWAISRAAGHSVVSGL